MLGTLIKSQINSNLLGLDSLTYSFLDFVHRLICNETRRFGIRLRFPLQGTLARNLVDPLRRVFLSHWPSD